MTGSPTVPGAETVGLGADVPMCLDPRPWRARGIGERLIALALERDLPAVLVWPGRALSTPAVFAALAAGATTAGEGTIAIPESSIARFRRDPVGALRTLRNALTDAACQVEPMVAEALAAVGRARRLPPRPHVGQRLGGVRAVRSSRQGGGRRVTPGRPAPGLVGAGYHPAGWRRPVPLAKRRLETEPSPQPGRRQPGDRQALRNLIPTDGIAGLRPGDPVGRPLVEPEIGQRGLDRDHVFLGRQTFAGDG